MSEGIRIAALTELEEYERCVELQMAVWGYDAADRVPRKMFRVAERIGGMVQGAYLDPKTGHRAGGDTKTGLPAGGDTKTCHPDIKTGHPAGGAVMVGFALALPGYRAGRAYMHSHMLAVLPEYRNSGLGRRLKLAQREEALRRGIDRMEWTFDPLEIKNAYLNVAKLGAIVRRYERDFYGPSSSPLQGGLPTDRLVAEWWLRSARVVAAVEGKAMPEYELRGSVEVPAEVYGWKQSEGERWRAAEVQGRNRAALEKNFGEGLAVVGYALDGERNGSFLLANYRPEEETTEREVS